MINKTLNDVKNSNRKILNELEGNQILSQYGIPMAKTILAKSSEEAIDIAERMGYPIVLKILSPEILHKTDAGCVRVGLKNRGEVEKAYNEILENAKIYNPDAEIKGVIVQEMMDKGLEVIFGIKKDAQFGHTIIFGLGGIYVEVFEDISIRLVPITRDDAYSMVSETKVSKILTGARGKNYNIDEVIEVLMKLSNLVQEYDDIEEIDINPFILYENGRLGKGVDTLITISKAV